MVDFDKKLYPTHETRVCLFFGKLSIPPPLKDDQLLHDRPSAVTSNPATSETGRAPLSDILNPVLISTRLHDEKPMTFDITGSSLSIFIWHIVTMDIDSDSIFLTVTEVIRDHKTLHCSDSQAFDLTKRGEIKFLLKDAVIPIQISEVPESLEIQNLKWILVVKTATGE